jgi:conjugal transfer pilus assembly protein TraV
MIYAAGGIALSGCSIYSSEFDCPYGNGMGCSSLSTVDKMIDSKAIDLESDLAGISQLENSKAAVIYFGKERMGRLIKITPQNI